MGKQNGDDPRQLFVDNLERINRIVRWIVQKKGLKAQEADDFRSEVYLRLIRDDYAVFRQFQGRSSLNTYLVAVITRLFLDRMRRKGRWKPSAAARKLGPIGVLIDRSLNRDGWSEEETFQILKTNHGLDLTRESFAAAAARVPARQPLRQMTTLEGEWADTRAPFDSEVERREAAVTFRLTRRQLRRSLQKLPPDERRLLRMRFTDGFNLAAIARKLGSDYKKLYRQFNRALQRLRRDLERKGLNRSEVLPALSRASNWISERRL